MKIGCKVQGSRHWPAIVMTGALVAACGGGTDGQRASVPAPAQPVSEAPTPPASRAASRHDAAARVPDAARADSVSA
ncbi:MAG: hypothetical protein R8K47_00680, partial [Mariprofundaceae bacterium]